MRSDATPFVIGQIRRVSLALHSAERRQTSRSLRSFQTVSLERLSGNSERAPLRGLTSLRNRTKGHHLDASRYRKTRDPTRAASFQTVSLSVILRSSTYLRWLSF